MTQHQFTALVSSLITSLTAIMAMTMEACNSSSDSSPAEGTSCEGMTFEERLADENSSQACVECTEAAESSACAEAVVRCDVDPECVKYRDCVSGCSAGENCEGRFPNGKVIFDEIAACTCELCAANCCYSCS